MREDLVLSIAEATARAGDVSELARNAGPTLATLMGASHVIFFRRTALEKTMFLVPGQPDLLPMAPRECDDPLVHLIERGVPDIAPVSALVDQKVYRRSTAFHEFYYPYELEHSIFVRLRDEGGPAANTGLGLFRPKRPWTYADLALMTRLRPMLALVAERARADSGLGASVLLEDVVEALDDGARFVIDLEGRLSWQSQRASLWLGATLDTWPGGVVSGAAKLAAMARGDGGGAVPELRIRHAGRALGVDLRLLRRKSGDTVVLGTVRQRQDEREAQAHWMVSYGLTRAEAAVLSALHAGGGNAEIARALHLSSHTVRTHLLRIFGKLGVATRLQAVLATRDASGAIGQRTSLPKGT